MKFYFLSENSVLLLFKQEISHNNFNKVCHYTEMIKEQSAEYIIDIVSSYASIQILFNIRKISPQQFKTHIETLATKIPDKPDIGGNTKTVEIPVYYGSEVGYDLENLAHFSGLTVEQVIQLHASKAYDVFAIGFSPGFAYLGIVDERIAMPRKETPRASVPAGSLAIAGMQTAVYPSQSPGGWQIIGRTPAPMIDYSEDSFSKVNTGDRVVFLPINRDEYLNMGGKLN